jgi:cell division protein FtsL
MEPNDNTQFTGTSQSESLSLSQPKSNKGSKIFIIILIVLVLGLAAGCVFFFMQSSDNNKKIDDLQSSLDAANAELNELKGSSVVAPVSIDTVQMGELIKKEFPDSDIVIWLSESSFIKNSQNNKFQIAKFEANDNGEPTGAFGLVMYRTLPDGKWQLSNFTGHQAGFCSDYDKEDIEAFAGVLECIPDENAD